MKHPPLSLRFRMRGKHLPSLNLWLPLFLVWPFVAVALILLSPLLLVLLGIGFVMFSIRFPFWETLATAYAALCGLSGLRVDVKNPREQIEIEFR